MHTLTSEQLETITGGVDWRYAHQNGKEYGKVGAVATGSVGAILGAGAGGPDGALAGGLIGLGLGGVGGYALGFGQGVIDTWNK